MKLFADANILVSVLNKEYPGFPHNARILSLADTPRHRVFTSPVCLAIAFYFAEKKYRAQSAKQRIHTLCQHIEIAEISQAAVRSALSDPAVKDFEDGLEYYSALDAGCDCIITDNSSDFYFSKIEVLSGLGFYERYMSRPGKL